MRRRGQIGLTLALLAGVRPPAATVAGCPAQTPAGQTPAGQTLNAYLRRSQAAADAQKDVVARDAGLDAARLWIGRALIVRGFYTGSELVYDPRGHVTGAPKTTDWTLAGFNLEKVTRRPAGSGGLALEGTRVAIRFAPDRREFDRHVLKDEHERIELTGVADAASADAALRAIFSVGIDPTLQRSMPVYWLHYFIPASPWPADSLSGQEVSAVGAKAAGAGVSPSPLRKVEPGFTPEAERDHVSGVVELRLIVDAAGVPQRVAVVQPLGYGLDARAVANTARLRFTPGTRNGNAVAEEIRLRQTFDFAPTPVP